MLSSEQRELEVAWNVLRMVGECERGVSRGSDPTAWEKRWAVFFVEKQPELWVSARVEMTEFFGDLHLAVEPESKRRVPPRLEGERALGWLREILRSGATRSSDRARQRAPRAAS